MLNVKINLAFFIVQLENMRKLCNILIGKILKFIIILFIFLKYILLDENSLLVAELEKQPQHQQQIDLNNDDMGQQW